MEEALNCFDSAAAPSGVAPSWLKGGTGTVALAISARDWSETSLGPLHEWPATLKRNLRQCLESGFPFALVWGSEHVQLYNDAFLRICGDKHPLSLGQPFDECWSSVWPAIGEAFLQAWRGVGSYVEDQRLFLDRKGALAEAFVTFSFGPVRDDEGHVVGVLLPVVETTSRLLAERRTRLLRDLVATTAGAASAREVLTQTARQLGTGPFDVPFALVYAIDDQRNATLVGRTRSTPEHCAPAQIPSGEATWGLAEVLETARPRPVSDLIARFGELSSGPYVESPESAVLLPITPPGRRDPVAVLVAAVSPRLVLDDEYRSFFERLGDAVTTSVSSALAHEEQRRRAEQLAALDRAKTVFFSNVSHEFRTPLTLMAGPLEDELAEWQSPLPEPRRQRLEIARRNTQRLIKLVNVLLDFSRIEAGRFAARFQPTDIATLTSELVAMFRSTIERVGLVLTIEIEPLDEPVFVDREMWEKIVLNLMSNAFKHTFEGGVNVCLRSLPDRIELDVSDSGVGIDEQELPLLFERFRRVLGAPSRTHEGTGIGLALVSELARLHGGDVRVVSELGCGSTFTVSVPRGHAHLPAEQIDFTDTVVPTGVGVAAYVQEAQQWAADDAEPRTAVRRKPEDPSAVHRPRILLADDNADMRDYVTRLLSDDYEVSAAADGLAALALAHELKPSLVLTDVMMPRLDGMGLLRALRADPRTHQLPVILLSARAGDEATIQGLDAGADDYLLKPFSARELLARVRAHVELSRARQNWSAHLTRVNEELEAFSYSVSHDLRTPLRAIDGFSKAILSRKGDQLDDEAKHFLARIRRASAKMGDLIDQLLGLSRVTRAPLNRQRIALDVVSKSVAAELKERHPEQVVELVVDEGILADADPRLLHIALANLLENAWKFSARASSPRIHVGRLLDHHPPVYFVEDNGIGFDDAYAHRLFQPFQRLHAEGDFAGTGIGLAIVQRIVSRHGGRIWAKSEQDRGATFYFTLSGGA